MPVGIEAAPSPITPYGSNRIRQYSQWEPLSPTPPSSGGHLFGREIDRLPQGLDQAAFISEAFASDVESGAMVDRGTDDRQSDGDVHAGFKTHYLDGAMALVVIHRHHDV